MRLCGLVAALGFIAALAAPKSFAGADAMTLGPSNPALGVPSSSLDRSTGSRFVLVDVAEINNPDRFPLSLGVYFQPSEGERIHLGSFAPYPVDQPGRFIVPVRGLVHDDGCILVRIDPGDEQAIPERLEVRVRRVMLTDLHPEAVRLHERPE